MRAIVSPSSDNFGVLHGHVIIIVLGISCRANISVLESQGVITPPVADTMDFSNTYCNSYVSPSVQPVLDPGVGGQHPLILRHHHHVRLPRLVDEYLSGSSGLQELWGGPPLGCSWYKNVTLVLKRFFWVNFE